MFSCWVENVDQVLEEGRNGAISLHLKLKRSPDFTRLAQAIRTLHSVENIAITDYTGSEVLWNNTDDSHNFTAFFEALGSLSNLKSIRLEHFGNPYLHQNLDLFPLEYISTVLKQPNCSLESLDIEHLAALGNTESICEFSRAIQKHSTLRNFRMFLCRLVGPNNNNPDAQLTRDFINQVAWALSTTGEIESIAMFMERSNIFLTPESMKQLVCCNPHLRELVLNGISIDDESLAVLAQALTTTKQLTMLELNLNEEIKAGGMAFARSLQDNRSLKRLKLVDLRQPTPFLLALAQALKFNTALKELYLVGSTGHVEEEFLRALEESNCSLEILHIQNCHSKYWARIAFYLSLNRRGRNVSEFLTLTRSQWVDRFVESNDNLSYLYYFMRMNPSLANESGRIQV